MIVELEALKRHLNVDSNADDQLLTDKIAAACATIENLIGETLDDFDPTPAPLVEAALQLAAHFYENREPFLVGSSASALPWNCIDLIMPYRRWVL